MDEHLNQGLLAKISWLYYYEDLSQQEIGSLLDIPRIKVVRLLKAIRERKIVEIKISRRYISLFQTEKAFKEATGLRDVTVVPSGKNPASNVAYAASIKFGEFCRRYECIGLGASRAVLAALNLLEPMKKVRVKRIVSLSGNAMPNYALNMSHPGLSGIMLSKLLGIDYFNIWAPAIASTLEMAQLLRSDYVVESVLKMANSVDCAMIGIGDITNSVLLNRGFIQKENIADMLDRGAVGDIFTHFFSIDGTRITTSAEERSITADVPMKCPVLAVAYGKSKVQPILGAIRGHLITGLVTDENTATEVLKLLRGEKPSA
ncbi:MAG: sugar-binding domain-containing protein [Rectinemataceae bacterium]|jgi:DNA-binding transcriptional regulator LsrR (DeoR family)